MGVYLVLLLVVKVLLSTTCIFILQQRKNTYVMIRFCLLIATGLGVEFLVYSKYQYKKAINIVISITINTAFAKPPSCLSFSLFIYLIFKLKYNKWLNESYYF